MVQPKKAAAAIPQTTMIPVSSILIPEDVPNRMKGWDSELKDLTESINTLGLIQPIVVMQLDKEGPKGEAYRLVAGRRRLECVRRLKQTTIKAVALPAKTSKKDAYGARVAENFVRKNYTPLEEAALIDYAVNQLHVTQQEFAEMVGMTAGWVSQRLTATKQPEDVQEALEKGDITFTHVRELARVKDDKEKQKLLKHAIKENAQDFKARVETALSGDKPEGGSANAEHKSKEPNLDRKPRPRREVLATLAKLDKALSDVTHAEKKAQLVWFIKGVSWTYRLAGANPPKPETVERCISLLEARGEV